jgi:predicted enzyme related to lactoylglutathione lyase
MRGGSGQKNRILIALESTINMQGIIMSNAINWFELPSTNLQRAMAFYSQVLGAEFQKIDMGDVELAFFPTKDQGVGGCLTYGNGNAAPDRVEALGAAVFQEIDSLKANGARQQDVDKVKETLRRSYETNLKENGYWLGQLSAYYRIGDDPRLLLSYPQVIESLTPDLVKQSAARFLRTDNFIQVTLLPQR